MPPGKPLQAPTTRLCPAKTGDVERQGIGAFQGLETSRLSIGLDFFENYAAQRIAKDAARYAALAHVHSDEAQLVTEQTGTNDPDELAGHIADNQLDHFLSLAGLSELGPERNQLKDALRPDQATRDALLSDARSTAYRLGEVGQWHSNRVGVGGKARPRRPRGCSFVQQGVPRRTQGKRAPLG